MRLRQLSLIRYGKFTDRLLELPAAAQDIHLIVGPNEAGKSTSRSAISDLLFGIPLRTPLAFMHPMPELRLGGVLEQAGANLEFQRSKGNKQTLRTPSDAVLPDSALQPWLGDSSRAVFEQMHALDHAALVRGGDGILSAADDLGRLLFQSAAGIEQLGPVLAALEEEEGSLWAPRKSTKRQYYLALEAYEDAVKRLKEASARSRDWKDQQDALREAGSALQAVQAQQRELRVQRSRLERIRRVRPALHRRDLAASQLLALGVVSLLPDDAAALVAASLTETALANAEIQRHSQALEAAEQALAGQRIESAILAQVAEIRALGEDRLQARGHRDEIARRSEALQSLWRDAQAAAARIGWPAQDEDSLRMRLPSASLLDQLQSLIQHQAGRQQRREAAQSSLQAKQQELAQAAATLRSLPPAEGNPALQAVLERARRLGDFEASLHELQDQRARLEAQWQKALAQLGDRADEPAALRAMLTPDAALLNQLLANRRRDDGALQQALGQLASRCNERERAQRELDHWIAAYQPVSREQLLAARAAREAGWRAIRAAPAQIEGLAPSHEQAVAQADALADLRLERIQHETERQSRTQRIELLALEIEQEERRCEALRRQLEAAGAQWQALAEACRLPGLPLELAADWLAARQRALDAADALDEAGRRCTAREAQIESARRGLVEVLGGEPGLVLGYAIKLAETQLDQLSRTQGQRGGLLAQIADANKALAGLQLADDEAQRQWQAWHEAWNESVTAVGFSSPEPSTQQAAGELVVIASIAAALEKIRALRVDGIERMQSELEALARRAHALAQALAPELLEGGTAPGADEIVPGLLARAEAAVRANAESERLARSRREAQAGLEAATARLRAVSARLSPLAALAGTSDPAGLGTAIEQSERRRVLEGELTTADQQLASEGDGMALDALRAEAETGGDPAGLQAQLDALAQDDERLVEQASQLGAAQEKARTALTAFDGSDRAARADADRQDAITRMTLAAEGYVKARAASRLLKWSIEQYRQTRQGPLLGLASGIFAALTLGSFNRLVVDFDHGDNGKPQLQGLRADGRTVVGVEGMSEGTRDQLYLALRLAALDMHADSQPRNLLPFIADDLFINFDDRRAAAGLRALGVLSRKTQVLFLTHHLHLVDVAREVLGHSLNVVTL